MMSLLDRDPRLTCLLSFSDKADLRVYEQFSLKETPIRFLLLILIISTVAWVSMLLRVGSELSASATGAFCFTYCPVACGFLYLYTSWIFQSKSLFCAQTRVFSVFDEFLIQNISMIGNSIILMGIFGFGAVALLHDYDSNSDSHDTLEMVLNYRNFASVIVYPVFFPLHSYWINLIMIPFVVLINVLVSEETPMFTQVLVLFCLVLYFVTIGAKKRFLLHMELASVKEDLSNSESEVKEAKIATLDMHHMIGSMTHDLKTPLQAFTFELDNLSADIKQINLSSSVSDLSEIKASAEINVEQMKVIISFMTMAINRSLDYTKASTGVKLVPSISPINVQESSNWVAMCLTQQRKKNVNVIVEPLPVDVCNTILTDKQWLIENLFCYLSNAQKFTTEGEIKIRFMIKSRSKISSLQGVCKGQLLPLSIHPNKEMSEFDRSSGTTMLLVEVEDSGIGLSDAQKNDLFKPFKQAQSRTGGTGLGLYAMYMRVATLGGSCGVRDRADGKSGSIFWFSIPYVPEVNLEEDMVSPISVSMMKSTDEYIPPEAKFRRILVVDDSPLIQKATKRSLEREGYIVDLADNGFECLKMINSTEMIYDLILLDLNMPVMDGMETVSRIRAQEQNACCINDIGLSDDIELCQNNANVPKMANVVVGFSGNSDAETVAEARKAGMDAFLAKPLSPQDLRSLCRYMHQETFA